MKMIAMVFHSESSRQTLRTNYMSILFQICSAGAGTKVFDEEQLVPYAFRDDVWVGFDDYRSIACKVNMCVFEDASL